METVRNMSIAITGPNISNWHKSCVHSECTFHQLSPYIGKLKSTIASDFIHLYSKPGDLVVDPFSGSGTVPLESILLGRKIFAADISSYSHVLTVGKLSAPKSVEIAIDEAKRLLRFSRMRKKIDLRCVPKWVRNFYNPETLREAISFADTCIKHKSYFIFSCFLGILHHQRPGFLSYPSSHLVPYLRNKSFPKNKFPELYEYRDLESRLISKVQRAYKRSYEVTCRYSSQFQKGSIETISFPRKFNCLITSPPYMNALDYVRDNRLRMWFTDRQYDESIDDCSINNKESFLNGMRCLAENTNNKLVYNGYAILVIGDKSSSNTPDYHRPSAIVKKAFDKYAVKLSLVETLNDTIPDIRRSRRECSGVKDEKILIYRKTKK